MEPQLTREQIAATTYRWDRVRGAGQGITETCWQVFALLVAIRAFQADESIKQFIPAGLGIGFLLSPLSLSLFNRLRMPVSTIISILWVLVAVALFLMTLANSVVTFVACIAAAQILASQGIPLLTHLYTSNYPSTSRGSRLSTTFVIASSCGIVFGYAGGKLLDLNEQMYPLLFGAGVVAALLYAWSVRNIPSEPAMHLGSRNPFTCMAIAWQDQLFRRMLIAWMLLGVGNLMLIPIRVEYLANPLYGINASNADVSILLISTVLVFRLLSTKLWGRLFDRVNVVTLRILINTIFTASIMLFFFTNHLWSIGIGCALLGTGFGGGGILWSLYVTKLASPDKVAAYMSVHGSTTGLRMALSPFIGYTVVHFTHPAFAAWISLCLISMSTILFLPLRPLIDAKAGELETIPVASNRPADRA